MNTALAWLATLAIFGTLAAVALIAFRFVLQDFRCARVTRQQIKRELARYVLPLHVAFATLAVVGWIKHPIWWPPYGPSVVNLALPCVAVGIADLVLGALLVVIWPRAGKP